MPKNKKGHPSLEDLLDRPWCYYCERDFDNLKILIDHQRHKHFKCERCGRRLNTAGGLSVHLNHVHKETLGPIENALPNRSSHEIEIFGMEGIPDEIANAHRQRVLSGYAQAEAERRAGSGAGGGGGPGGSNPAKKPKTESVSEMKKRLAEHKAKKAAEEAAAAASPANTADAQPIEAMNGQQGGFNPVPGMPPQGTYQADPFNGASGAAMYGAAPQPYGQPNPAYPQQPPYHAPPAPFSAQPPQFNQPGFQQPPQQFPQAPFPHQFPNGQPPYQGGAPAFHPNNMMHPQTPPQGAPPMQRPSSIGPAPGLPQRPMFSTPPVNPTQMQQIHQGMNPNAVGGYNSMTSPPPGTHNGPTTIPQGATPFTGPGDAMPLSGSGAPLTAATENGEQRTEASGDKKSKKDKDKDVRLVFSDNEVSPEEKMAKLPRYAFDPAEHKEKTVLKEAMGGGGVMVYAAPPAGPEDGPRTEG